MGVRDHHVRGKFLDYTGFMVDALQENVGRIYGFAGSVFEVQFTGTPVKLDGGEFFHPVVTVLTESLVSRTITGKENLVTHFL